MAIRAAVYRRAVAATSALFALAATSVSLGANPWDDDEGSLSYASVEQRLDYAGSHGPDIVVLMGEEIVVAGPNARDAGKRIHRRFTDVFRKENGEWRHDLRHANVISTE
jgi:hypothetical protein